MAANLELGSGVAMTTPKPVDFYGKFDAIDETTAVTLALASIPSALRYIGRRVLCNGIEYRFINGITDVDLVKYQLVEQTLETVTTAGAITDNDITVGEITTSKVIVSSGLSTQILHADGSLEENRFNDVDEATAVTLALTSIPLIDRWIGRKVLCNNVEYTFVEGIADTNFTKTEYNVSPIINGFKNAIIDEEYNEDFVGVNVSTNQTNYKSLRYRRGSRTAPSFANPFLYHALTYTPFVESCANGRIFENSVDLKRGVHVENIQVFSSIQRTQNGLPTPSGGTSGERGTVGYVAQYEAYGCNFGSTENIGFRSKLVQNSNNTIIRVSRDNTLSPNLATITTGTGVTPTAHGYSVGDTVQINEPALGFPKTSVSSISWQRINNTVTLNVASHTFAIDDTITVATLNITGLITATTTTSISFVNHGADVVLTNAVYSISHRTWVVITAVPTTSTFRFVNTGSFIAPNTPVIGGTTTAPIAWNHRASGSAPNGFAGKTYFGTANALDRTPTLTSVEVRAGTNQLGYAAADAHPSYFGRNGHFGNTVLTTPTVTVPDINVISEGAIIFGNTTTGTPPDGTLSKLPNGDANYFSNGTWRGLLHVLGGSGVNANIVTNTANALLKFVGNGLRAISSLLVDTGTSLSYSGTGGFSLTGANATLSSPRALLESNLAVNGIIAELINLQSGTQALVTTALNTASNYHNNSLSATGNTTFGKVIKVTIIGGTFGGAGNTAISITVLGRTITLPTIANNVRFTCSVIFNQLGANISANGLITAEGVNGGTVTTVANAAFVNGNCSISITGGNSIAISRLTIEQINR